jgi:hypothetical protein
MQHVNTIYRDIFNLMKLPFPAISWKGTAEKRDEMG